MRELSVIRVKGRTEEIHHAEHDRGAPSTDRQAISNADSLWDDSRRMYCWLGTDSRLRAQKNLLSARSGNRTGEYLG